MFARIRLLPVFIAVAALVLAFKVNNIFMGVETMVQPAIAQDAAETQPAQTQAAEPAAQPTNQRGGAIDPLMMSRSELDLLQDLSSRRVELDALTRELDTRERLLEATERRIDEKIVRLETLEARMAALVRSYEDNENTQLQSLVKVYETMKPKDAARIFARLGMDIQLEVATRMKEAKMAPIMAAMPAEAAEALTVELATRAVLPELDGS